LISYFLISHRKIELKVESSRLKAKKITAEAAEKRLKLKEN
jgi:hypothetical protein